MPLNRNAPRYSGDIDIFQDREEWVAKAADKDVALLKRHGYTLQWRRREAGIYSVLAELNGEKTRLEWVWDSDFRFFPAVRDEMFGYILHPVDLATNKVSAAYGRRRHETRWTYSPFMTTFFHLGQRFGPQQARL